MKPENISWTKNTDVTEEQLKCKCGRELDIVHCSNWHNDSGIFYTECECGNQTNVRWHKKKKDNTIINK